MLNVLLSQLKQVKLPGGIGMWGGGVLYGGVGMCGDCVVVVYCMGAWYAVCLVMDPDGFEG